MKQVVLGLGGNEGDVVEVLTVALNKVGNDIGEISLKSSLYKTSAWGVENQPDFINMVVSLKTSKTAEEVLKLCLSIEKELGRNRIGVKKWHQRVIDIDVLFYADEVIDLPHLKVPHPYVQERNFVLVPLAEILPNSIHPQFKKSFVQLKNESKDVQKVILLDGEI